MVSYIRGRTLTEDVWDGDIQACSSSSLHSIFSKFFLDLDVISVHTAEPVSVFIHQSSQP
jgi:hypothetical protein